MIYTKKCKNDPVYFIEKYYGETLQQYQQNIIGNKDNVFIDTNGVFHIDKEYVYLLIHEILFNHDKTIGIYVDSEDHRNNIIDMVCIHNKVIDCLFHPPKITRRSKTCVEFENGMRVLSGGSTQFMHSRTIHLFIMINIDKVNKYTDVLNEITPVIFTHHTKVIISGNYEKLCTETQNTIKKLKRITIS